ncbi:MAG: DUF1616 domain-containing protein [Chloroflexota bacterium]
MLRRHIEPDLLLIDILTLLLALTVLTLPVPWLRITLGFPFILFFPGYVLAAILFPRKDNLGYIPRIALSLGLSITITVFIGLILNFTPYGIALYPILLAVSLFVLFGSGFAWYARGRIDQVERSSVSLRLFLHSLVDSWRTAGKQYHSLIIILLCVILGGIGAFGYIMTKSPVAQPFTEFYILGIEGKAENYPQTLHPEEEGRVIVGIVNHEHEPINYQLEVVAGDNKLYEMPPISLEPDEEWQGVVKFTLQKTGDSQKVEFLLRKGNEQPSEIRYLWVNVRT